MRCAQPNPRRSCCCLVRGHRKPHANGMSLVSPTPRLVFSSYELHETTVGGIEDENPTGQPHITLMLATMQSRPDASSSPVPPPPRREMLRLTLADMRAVLAVLRAAANS